jgi:hypothetical protein
LRYDLNIDVLACRLYFVELQDFFQRMRKALCISQKEKIA